MGTEKPKTNASDNGDYSIIRLTAAPGFALIPEELWQLDDSTLKMNRVLAALPQNVEADRLTQFFLLLDPAIDPAEENPVVGFFWGRINYLTNRLEVYVMSMRKNYQSTGDRNRRFFKDLCRKIVQQNRLEPTVEIFTNHVKVLERHGLRPSRCQIMEWDSNEPTDGEKTPKESEERNG